MSYEKVIFQYKGQSVGVSISIDAERIRLKTPFKLKDEVKAMAGARWHPDEKVWSVKNNCRNLFAIQFLQGKNPYAVYDKPLIDVQFKRPLYVHQVEMAKHVMTRHYCGLAAEMGTGKSLTIIEVIELLFGDEYTKSLNDQKAAQNLVWWLAPKSGIAAVKLELLKWKAAVVPRLMTYDELKKVLTNWQTGDLPPRMVIFDESHKLKTITSQRSEAARHLAESVRREHGDNGYVVFMSGSPAPKSPLDWYNQCETVCPGYLKEGDIFKFQRTLALVKDMESLSGGRYPKIVTWWDDAKKCKLCGDHIDRHEDFSHIFEPSVNEIERLYRRLKGLVLVKFKKDCLDLPEKQYKTINIQPTREIVNAAKLIVASTPNAVKTLTLLRELSDGFQYRKYIKEIKDCGCFGKQTDPPCDHCHGSGKIKIEDVETLTLSSPKDEVVKDQLEEHDEVGRLVVYAGFTASIDKLTDLVKKEDWHWIRVDGRGWTSSFGITNDVELLSIFQRVNNKDTDVLGENNKIVFIGHPGSAGMGLTLTASPTILYYSNDFNGENRIQSEDRIHRPGADANRGCTIIDLIHLPTDLLVLNNLKEKRDLQAISLGDVQKMMV